MELPTPLLPPVTGRPDSQVGWENSAANATVLKSTLWKYSPEIKNDHFPDTTSVTKKAKIFEEYVLEAAVAVEVKEKEADESELDEGTKSMNND